MSSRTVRRIAKRKATRLERELRRLITDAQLFSDRLSVGPPRPDEAEELLHSAIRVVALSLWLDAAKETEDHEA